MTRRRVVGLTAAIAVGVVIAAVVIVRHEPADQPSGAFCSSFEDIEENVDEARRALDGTPDPADLDLQTQRAVASITWSAKTAAGAPSDLDPAAQRVASAMRSALLDGRREGLDEPAIRRDVEQLARVAPEVCQDPSD